MPSLNLMGLVIYLLGMFGWLAVMFIAPLPINNDKEIKDENKINHKSTIK